MACPERPKNTPSTLSELASELESVEQQLELVDENENQIERFFRRDELLEQLDALQFEIDEMTSQI